MAPPRPPGMRPPTASPRWRPSCRRCGAEREAELGREVAGLEHDARARRGPPDGGRARASQPRARRAPRPTAWSSANASASPSSEQRRGSRAPRGRARRRRARRRQPVPQRPRAPRRRRRRRSAAAQRGAARRRRLRARARGRARRPARRGRRRGLDGANSLLDRAGPDGGTALLAEPAASARAPSGQPASGAGEAPAPGRGDWSSWSAARPRCSRSPRACSPTPGSSSGSRPCPATSRGSRRRAPVARSFGAAREVRQLGEGGSERVLARRNERDRLIAATAEPPRRRRPRVPRRDAAATRARAGRTGTRRGRHRRPRRGARQARGRGVRCGAPPG